MHVIRIKRKSISSDNKFIRINGYRIITCNNSVTHQLPINVKFIGSAIKRHGIKMPSIVGVNKIRPNIFSRRCCSYQSTYGSIICKKQTILWRAIWKRILNISPSANHTTVECIWIRFSPAIECKVLFHCHGFWWAAIDITLTIKIICGIRLAITIGGESSIKDNSIIPIPTFIIRIPIKRPITN